MADFRRKNWYMEGSMIKINKDDKKLSEYGILPTLTKKQKPPKRIKKKLRGRKKFVDFLENQTKLH